MSTLPPTGPSETGLARLGRASWQLVGVAVAAVLLGSALASISGLVVPLVIATVIGVLVQPAVEWLTAHRCPRMLAATLVILGLLAVAAGTLWLTVVAVIDRGAELATQISHGIAQIDAWIEEQWDLTDNPGSTQDTLAGLAGDAAQGLARWFPTIFASAASFALGAFIAVFVLYYVLTDWSTLRTWLAGHLGVSRDLGEHLIGDAVATLRRYFVGLTVSSIATALLIGVTAVLLDVPLAITIAVVTFVTSYIPYLGAFFSGTLAVLVALGSAGVTEAVVLLLVVLVAQNVVQTVILVRMTSEGLRLHPIANLASTIVGGAVAGIVGAALSAPALAVALQVRARLAGDATSEPSDTAGPD